MIRRRRTLILLGSTGSIGRSTLDVVRRDPDRWRVSVLAANRSVPLLLAQAREFKPAVLAVADSEAAGQVRRRVRAWKRAPKVLGGPEGVRQAAAWPRADLAVSAMVGMAGLLPTLAAIRAGKDIALANKETLVMAGDIVMSEARRRRVRILPVDSEHAALAQCLHKRAVADVQRLILTASGGPFAAWPGARLRRVTVQDALRHPTWSMGRKITIDSSTLMNKGLEIIEAHHLFGIPYERIDVTVHPQSIVHSMVEFRDGSVLAQMAVPDMRLPIQTALAYPEIPAAVIKPLDFAGGLTLTFGPPDTRRFPCLNLAYRAGKKGGTAPAALNAANEVAVQAFLEGGLDFPGIPRLIAGVLARHRESGRPDLRRILEQDAWARHTAKEILACKR